MTTDAPTQGWPVDSGHREAIDTLLVMAEAEERWGEPRRAVELLLSVESIVGELPQQFARIRSRCDSAIDEQAPV